MKPFHRGKFIKIFLFYSEIRLTGNYDEKRNSLESILSSRTEKYISKWEFYILISENTIDLLSKAIISYILLHVI